MHETDGSNLISVRQVYVHDARSSTQVWCDIRELDDPDERNEDAEPVRFVTPAGVTLAKTYAYGQLKPAPRRYRFRSILSRAEAEAKRDAHAAANADWLSSCRFAIVYVQLEFPPDRRLPSERLFGRGLDSNDITGRSASPLAKEIIGLYHEQLDVVTQSGSTPDQRAAARAECRRLLEVAVQLRGQM